MLYVRELCGCREHWRCIEHCLAGYCSCRKLHIVRGSSWCSISHENCTAPKPSKITNTATSLALQVAYSRRWTFSAASRLEKCTGDGLFTSSTRLMSHAGLRSGGFNLGRPTKEIIQSETESFEETFCTAITSLKVLHMNSSLWTGKIAADYSNGICRQCVVGVVQKCKVCSG